MRSVNRAVALVLGLVLGATLSAAPVLAVEPEPTPLPATVTFQGRGYGHGVGMSQYGALGRALAGQSWQSILLHYYKDTTLGTIPADTPIRVRVLVDMYPTTGNPLILYGRRGSFTIDGLAPVFPTDAKVEVTPRPAGSSPPWRVVVRSPGGSVLHDGSTWSFRMRPTSAATSLQVWSRTSSYDEYRGVLRVLLSSPVLRANVVNEVPLETYLRGVVPAEMPSGWHATALKVQAVAARSFAARRLRPTVGNWDVADDSTSQVYLGLEGEKAATDAAITATVGTVVKKGSEIANTLFHSAAGAWTEHNENVFVSASGAQVASPVSYLRGRSDRRPNGTSYDDASPYATWSTATYTRAQLSSWFGSDSRTNVGTISAIDLGDRGVSGRLISVTLIGSLGTKTVSGDVFRSIFNAKRPAADKQLRSTLFTLVSGPVTYRVDGRAATLRLGRSDVSAR